MSNVFIIFTTFIGVVLLILGMVFLYLKIIPGKYDGTFGNKALQFVHDYFNFKKLYLETVLKFLFTLLTVACEATGIAGIINTFLSVFRNVGYMIDGWYDFGDVLASFFGGIIGCVLFMILAPVVIRLIYEGFMMFILLVKNVIELNNKTKDDK